MNRNEFKQWLTDRLAELEPTIGRPASQSEAAIVAEAKQHCYALGLHDFALSLPDDAPAKTPLACCNQLRRCLQEIETPTLPDGDVLDPPAAARLVGCSPDTIRDWIRSGQLRAANVARGSRPLWKIQRDDLDTFLESRNHTVIPRAERRRVDPDVIEFF